VSYREIAPGAFLKVGSAALVRDTSFMVLDFDGVLVSVSESYREAIRRAVQYYFSDILRLDVPEELVSVKDVQRFKDSGLFNNDWTLTYALIQYFLSLCLLELRKAGGRIESELIGCGGLPELVASLAEVGDRLRGMGIRATPSWKVDHEAGLDPYIRRVAASAQLSVKAAVISSLIWLSDREKEISRRLAPYEDEMDLVRRLLEEIYLGGQLFKKFYGQEPMFIRGGGYIDRERRIPTLETMSWLRQRFGALGIYSERPREQGLYALQLHALAQFFLPEAIIFQEDMIARAGRATEAGKPNPQLLLRLLSDRHGITAYVGDTIADAALVQNARRTSFSRLLFVGTYGSTPDEASLVSKYKEMDADIIVRDVNRLPEIVIAEVA